MKHQALSRVISAVLAVMCLVTLISGVAGFVSAGKDFSQDRSDYKTLRDRIAEAESLDAQLNCGKDEYDKTAAELKAEKGQYDDDASRHREELTEYTATNAGPQMGSGSIGSAASTLEEGWKQYNAAREQFALNMLRGGTLFNQNRDVTGTQHAPLSVSIDINRSVQQRGDVIGHVFGFGLSYGLDFGA